MTTTEVLKLQLADLDAMTVEQRQRTAHVCRSIRGTVYGIATPQGIRNWERHTGTTVEQAKGHTLGLLYRLEELDELS